MILTDLSKHTLTLTLALSHDGRGDTRFSI